jgi:hypothetical protein
MIQILFEIIAELTKVIYDLQRGEQEWDDYNAVLDRAERAEEQIRQQVFWQGLNESIT